VSSKPRLTEVTGINVQMPRKVRKRFWGLLAEVRNRKVARTAISYMLVMWLNLQIGDVVFPMIGLPDWSLSLIVVVGVMGFPVVLILSWAFQVTPSGIVLDAESGSAAQVDRQIDTVVNVLLLVLSIVLSVLLLLQFFTTERISLLTLAEAEEPPAVVVSSLSFESATHETTSRTVATGIREELRHRLINLKGIEVAPEAMQQQFAEGYRRVALSGSLLLEGDTAHVLANLIDLSASRYLTSIAFNLQASSTLDLESAAAERIIGELTRTLGSDREARESTTSAEPVRSDGVSR